MKMIALEGIDDHKIREIQKTLQQRIGDDDKIWDSFTGKYIVMSIFNDIEIDVEEMLENEEMLERYKVVFPVYLIPNKKELVHKIRRKELDIEICDIDKILHIYKKYLLKTPYDYFLLNTSYKTISQCAKEILDEYQIRSERK